MSMLRAAALRPAAPLSRMQVRFATQDYGSGAGNPAGEKPEKQGQNPSENIEHPGPPPPKVAQGQSSSSPNKDGGSNSQPKADSSTSNAKTGSSSGKREFSTSARRFASKEPAVAQGKQNAPSKSEVKGAQPKILNENPPKAEDESGDVKQHNKEVKQRAEKPAGQVSNEDAGKDKVPGM